MIHSFRNQIGLFLLGLFFVLSSFSLANETSQSEVRPKSWSFVTLGQVPVQSGGRVKPLDTYAREVVLFSTGSRSYQGWNALDLILSWIAYPDAWKTQPLIQIGREDVRRQLGLDEKRTSYSTEELMKNSNLHQYAHRLGEGGVQGSEPPGTPKSSPREQELRSVVERINLFHGLVSGQSWPLIPRPVPAAWGSLIEGDQEGEFIRSHFIELLKSYQSGDENQFQRSAELLRAAVEGEIPSYQENLKRIIVTESLYNRTRPFLWSWIFYLSASLFWIIYGVSPEAKPWRGVKTLASFATLSAMGCQVFGVAMRCFIAGRPPVTNMYESVIWVSLGIMIFASILYSIHRQGVIMAVATSLATLGLIAGDAAPAILDPSIHPLVPVLRSNYWLTIHVLTITLGYAAFALSLGLANITLFQFMKNAKAQKITSLNQLTYRAMQFGVVLIAAGTILGGIWADYSWGRFWGWDPKEVWALITLLAYLVILHGRFTNWMGQFGFAAWSSVAFMTVVMAWYGVNFILGVGLHSYGFATGGTPWVIGFVAVQLTYILVATGLHFNRKRVQKWSKQLHPETA